MVSSIPPAVLALPAVLRFDVVTLAYYLLRYNGRDLGSDQGSDQGSQLVSFDTIGGGLQTGEGEGELVSHSSTGADLPFNNPKHKLYKKQNRVKTILFRHNSLLFALTDSFSVTYVN